MRRHADGPDSPAGAAAATIERKRRSRKIRLFPRLSGKRGVALVVYTMFTLGPGQVIQDRVITTRERTKAEPSDVRTQPQLRRTYPSIPRPGGTHREWTDPSVLRQLRRRSLARLRQEIAPVEPAVLGRFVSSWHGAARKRRGTDALLDVVEQLQGAPLPASILETESCPRASNSTTRPTWTR